ncbi:MAG: SgcJ/EcaC family oxidoreductase [Opitutus sp.]
MNDEEEIRKLVATWMAATRAGDTETVLSLMADDVLFLVPGQPPMTKTGFAAALGGMPKSETPTFEGHSEIQEIEVCGDRAFMWTTLSVVVRPPGGAPPRKRAGHTLSVLKKEGGRWRLFRDANLLAPVAEG